MTIETTVYPPGRVGSNDTGPVRRTVLPNGLRIVTEVIPGVRSVAYGAWVGVGSRHEAAAQRGASHFLEHLLFKGTQRRDAMDIAKALDAVGGESNAITTKEYTCYYVRTRDADLPLAADLIGDMLTCARLDPAQVEAERRVILGELAMYEDDPGHAVQNLFAAALFGADDPLARPSAGDRESVLALSWEQIAAFYASRYRLGNVVVAAAGNVDHDEVVDLTSRGLSPDASVDGYSRPPASRPERREPGVRVLRRRSEQANIMFGVPGLPYRDPRRYALTALATALGGGYSSRLFQEIRERRGLAYATGSYAVTYADTGILAVYAVCDPQRVDEVLAAFRRELAAVVESRLDDEELERVKGQLAGKFVLSQDDALSRAGRLTQGELFEDEITSLGEVLRRIDAVSASDVQAVAVELLSTPATLAVVGPFDEDRAFAL